MRAPEPFVHSLGLLATGPQQLPSPQPPHRAMRGQEQEADAEELFGIPKVSAIRGLGSRGHKGLGYRLTVYAPPVAL